MKTIKENNTHIIKLEKGDKVIESLVNYAKENELNFCKVELFGAVSNVELGYMTGPGIYDWKTFNEGGYELLSAKGSIAWHEGKPQVHMHASISGKDFKAYGGHVKEMMIHGVGEVFLEVFLDKKMKKAFDEKSGLMLWDI
ncbi:MAG: DNA-binding protein [Mycoplasma sp.]|nr:DNA-binding protein [Mycoplasma sp.]